MIVDFPSIKDQIKDEALSLGFSDCRITSAAPPEEIHKEAFGIWLDQGMHGEMKWIEKGAEKRLMPQKILPEAKSAIVLALNYSNETGYPKGKNVTASNAAVIARYAQASDYHDFIGDRLKSLSQFVDQLTGVESRSLWYVDTGPILERCFAQRAGIGFAGKHTNLISRNFGNWFFIAEILTQAEMHPDEAEKNRCGKCEACLNACPTGALPKPFVLDSRKCISYLTIEHKGSIPLDLRPKIGQRVFGCDDCLSVCPWNKFAKQASELQKFSREDFKNSTLSEWLSLSDQAFRKKTRGTPLFRTKRSRFLRNVCVAMGNSGDKSHIPDLMKAKLDEDSLISEHAAWAIDQLEK